MARFIWFKVAQDAYLHARPDDLLFEIEEQLAFPHTGIEQDLRIAWRARPDQGSASMARIDRLGAAPPLTAKWKRKLDPLPARGGLQEKKEQKAERTREYGHAKWQNPFRPLLTALMLHQTR